MAQHRAEEQSSQKRYLAMGAGALVALLLIVLVAIPGVRNATFGGGTTDPVADTGDPAPADDEQATATAAGAPVAAPDCEEPRDVVVAAAPAVAGALEQAVAAQPSECFTFAIEPTPSVQVFNAVSSGTGAEADLWVPDSTMWVDLLAERGAALEAGPVLAVSPVVLAGGTDYVSGLGLGEAPEWSQMLTAGVPLRADDPLRDAASALTLMHASAALSEEERGGQLATQALIQLGRELRPAEDWREQALDGQEVLYPTSEQAVSRAPDGLSVVVPAGGLGALSFPVVPVDPAAADAGAALAEAATASEGVAALEAAGLRVGEDGSGPGVPGVPDATPALAEQPSGAQVAQAFTDWQRVTKPQRMLAVIDVSGSMDESVGGVSRIDVASGAAQGALSLMAGRTQVGLWLFSTGRGPGQQDWEEVLPIRPLGEAVDGQTHQQLLVAAAASLNEEATTGDTGLHDTVAGAYRHMVESYDPDYVNSVVLLTDGINDDPAGGLSEAQLLSQLQQLSDPERPVVLVLVGMGPEVDLQALQRITDAVGGRAYVARSPAEIGDVFVDALMNRQL